MLYDLSLPLRGLKNLRDLELLEVNALHESFFFFPSSGKYFTVLMFLFPNNRKV